MSSRHGNRYNEKKEVERKKKKEMKRKKEDEMRREKDDKKRKKKEDKMRKKEDKMRKEEDKMRREMLFQNSLSLLGKSYHDPAMMKEVLKSMLMVFRGYSKQNSRAFYVPDDYKKKFHALLYWYEFCFGEKEKTLLLDSLNDLDDHYNLVFLQLLSRTK